MQFYLVSCRVSECPLWLSLFVLYYPFSTFIFISPHYLCVCVLVSPKTLPISSSVCFFFMSCCLAFNAFYLLYFLAIRLWTFVLVRNSACLSIPFSVSLSLAQCLAKQGCFVGWTELCVCVCQLCCPFCCCCCCYCL